jgi:predicted ATPase/signal transduction histidine kinase
MLTITGFSLNEKIHSSTNTNIYRAIKDNQPVIIKALKDAYPSVEAIARLKHEYSIVRDLHNNNIVKSLNLETHDKRLVIVFEDCGGISLKQYLESTKPSVILTLEIAIAITQALIYIHSNNIIHKDIKPANIIINPTSGFVKVTDFSIASRLSKEIISNNPNQIEGTLAYMSPEQTGRMNRALDYRTDFYSLGVTLYELLTGKLPFQSKDVMELVHSHIALTPIPVEQINPDVPEVLAAIIDKLMAKNAEDRYQSAKGLLADLEQLASGNTTFIPGALDLRSQLLIPQKLYGREEQVKCLLNTFEEVAGGKSQLMLVSGYSGIGKTSVINEINKPITARKGYFVSGKFDQFKRDIPYASLIQALSSLMQELLTETVMQIQAWKEKIKAAVGTNGQVVIDVIPEVELIIGSQPEIAELPPMEAQNRFNRVFQGFIKVFCSKEHPLVIFLDDLQWADSATLKLMQLLVTDADIRHLLLIGAYRDNEVSPTHPLITTLEEIEKAGTSVSNIVLQPLDENNVGRLVAETLDDNQNCSQEFAELIFNKTGGNPFFITQLLQVLYQDSLLTFDFSLCSWQWNIEEIQAIGITDKSVVELVASRIEKLPQGTQEALKLAACIGDKFSLDVLSIVSEKSVAETAIDLNTALQSGLILPLSEAYRIPLVFQEEASIFDNHKISYKFLHDRVQQATYSLIPDSKKQGTHLKIGKLVRASTPLEKLEENILNIVNQLNFGIDLPTSQEEKYDLASLNLMAGKKAKKSNAYVASNTYLDRALQLITQKSWQDNYNLALNIYLEAAEVQYLNTSFDKSKETADLILKNVTNNLDKVKAYQIQMQGFLAQSLVSEVVFTGVQSLKLLGVELQKIPTISHVLVALIQTKLTLLGKQSKDLEKLPEMTDPDKLAAMQILMLVASAAAQTGTMHFPLAIFVLVRLSIQYGNSEFGSFAYNAYAAMLCDKFGDIEAGYQFGVLGLELLHRGNTNFLKGKVYSLFNAYIYHYKEPLKATISPLKEGVQSALESGDIEFVGYCAWYLTAHLFFIGENLEYSSEQVAKYIELLQKLKLESITVSVKSLQQTILNLQGKSSNTTILIGRSFHEVEQLPILGDNFGYLSGFYAYKQILNYLFENYKHSIDNAELIKKFKEKFPGAYLFSASNFYHSLALLAQYPKTALKERKQYLKQVATNQKKMKLWASHAACNFQHKYDLVEAEKAQILGKNSIAADLYDRAIAGAKTNNYTQEEALANELAGKFYLEQGKEKIAKVYMTEAYYAYIKWGAFAKVRDLEERYPNLIIRSTVQSPEIDVNHTISTSISTKTGSQTGSSSQILDLDTVVKASEAIQANMLLETLPYRLLRIIIQNAAAQRGCILLEKDNNFYIEAIEDTTNDNTAALQSIPFEKCDRLPHSVINYVSRTQQPLVIRNAALDPITQNDSYVKKHKCKSILCLPIHYQGKSIGIVYLENNLASGVFTIKRLELVKILASQAAISITNARLLSNEKLKSQQLQESLEQLEITQGQLVEKAKALTEAVTQLQSTQTQLVHTEKISALGQLVAGVAHEVNNPVSFISSNLSHANQYVEDLVNHLKLYQDKYPNPDAEIVEDAESIDLEYLLDDVPKMLNSMKLGTVRIKDIMQSLRNFSRNDGDQKHIADITEGIDSTILILGHRLKAGPSRPAIQIIKEYDTTLPKIECYPGQLNQVFMNLMANAIDALDESNQGKTYQEIQKNPNIITVRTKKESDRIQISIWDNGAGMNEETRQKLFAAFFTTKPEGKGTGLGLSISYQIVTEKHGGSLDCISQPGEGAEFVIEIPFKH